MLELSTRERAAVYIDLLIDDRAADASVRALAHALRGEVDEDPHDVIRRLQEASADCDYSFEAPDRDLAKAISIESYWGHYLTPAVKAWHVDAVDYARTVEASVDPSGRLLGDLRDSTALIPPRNAWLAPADDIVPLAAAELPRALELGTGARPPFAVLVFSLADLLACGVRVRTPRATDAVMDDQPQWRASGLASGVREWIDRAIPSAAVTSVEWRS